MTFLSRGIVQQIAQSRLSAMRNLLARDDEDDDKRTTKQLYAGTDGREVISEWERRSLIRKAQQKRA